MAVTAYLDVGEPALQVLRRNLVKVEVFVERPPPVEIAEGLDALVVDVVVRLVPNFPVGDRVPEAVRPALRVMRDHVLADSRPLPVVLRWEDAVGLDAAGVLDCHAEAEIRLNAVLDERLHQQVGKGEVVVGGVVLVRVEVAEEVRNVHENVLPEGAADIVEPRVRNPGLLEVMEHREVVESENWTLSDPVDGADRVFRLAEINLKRRNFNAASRQICRRRCHGVHFGNLSDPSVIATPRYGRRDGSRPQTPEGRRCSCRLCSPRGIGVRRIGT